jgi:hypothetical protein
MELKGTNEMQWQFTKRTDGKIAITLDNNVWNFLFDQQINLAAELSSERFAIYITREVEIETLAIPNHESKKELKEYIDKTIETCGIETTYVFGFAHEGSGPQRHGGFDVGCGSPERKPSFMRRSGSGS